MKSIFPKRFYGRWRYTLALGILGGLALVPTNLAAIDLEELLFNLQIVPLDGERAPDFTLESLAAKKLSLKQFHGRPVLLYFWATW